jgi:hypothetical protein
MPTTASGVVSMTRLAEEPRAVPSRLFVCAECAHAQVFAVQPRALCTCEDAPYWDRVLFAGQPGCPRLVPRRGADPIMAWCSPGTKQTSRRFAGPARRR